MIDPGPALEEHLDAIVAAIDRRGGLGGIALTHDHPDHTEAVAPLRARRPAPVAAGDLGPLRALATPGHAPDHLAFILDTNNGRVAFTGDAVLGHGSVFVAPGQGSLSGYLAALQELKALAPDIVCPGHGPVVTDPQAKLDEYLAHRLDRENRLVRALARGKRSVDELLDDVWADAPTQLRLAAAVTLAAHLDKLEEEGRLPDGVERPSF